MHVGFDIDDVLVDSYLGIVWTAKFLYDIDLPRKPRDFTILTRILTEEQKNKVLNYCLNNFTTCKVNHECVNLINELIDKKVQRKVVFITKRPKVIEEETLDFLNNIIPEGISFVLYNCDDNITKNECVKKEGITHYIEDRYKYSKQLADNDITVFMRKRPWNNYRKKHPNIFPFRNWAYVRMKLGLI